MPLVGDHFIHPLWKECGWMKWFGWGFSITKYALGPPQMGGGDIVMFKEETFWAQSKKNFHNSWHLTPQLYAPCFSQIFNKEKVQIGVGEVPLSKEKLTRAIAFVHGGIKFQRITKAHGSPPYPMHGCHSTFLETYSPNKEESKNMRFSKLVYIPLPSSQKVKKIAKYWRMGVNQWYIENQKA